jgi:hypothetical protein
VRKEETQNACSLEVGGAADVRRTCGWEDIKRGPELLGGVMWTELVWIMIGVNIGIAHV